jgi:hypothetical protein
MSHSDQIDNGPLAHVPRSSFSRWFETSSGWLGSAVVHMVVVIVLGLLSINLPEKTLPGIFLNTTMDVEDPNDVIDPVSDVVADVEIEEAEAISVRLAEMGMAAIGELVSDLTVDEVGTVDIFDAADPIAELGALLGDDGRGFAMEGTGKGGAMFFGVKAGGNRFAFIVDGSMSMNKNGWEFCKQELIYAVRRMKPDQYFYVFLFASVPYPMFGEKDPESMPVKATPDNISRLERWLARYELHLGTKPRESIEKALDMYPDAIYFLTDGKIQDDTEAYLKSHNRIDDLYDRNKSRAAVHTIGFFTLDGAEVLKRIADDNNGTFRYVAEPPGYKQFKQRQRKMAEAAGGGRKKQGDR